VRRANTMYSVVVWMSVCFQCFVLSCRGFCDGLIPCAEESYGCLSVVIVEFCQVEVCEKG